MSYKKPRISIVTPSFNQSNYLEECICSVLEQGYSNLEYIIVDGQSTDNSVDIIKKYANYLHFWRSEPDKGQTNAINKGLKMASGDIVAWLNSDDFYLPGAFEQVVECYQTFPEVSFYFGDGYRVDETGKIKNEFFPRDLSEIASNLSSTLLLPSSNKSIVYNESLFMLGMNYVLQPAAFMNAKYLKEVGCLDDSLRYGMDSDLWIRLAKLAEPRYIQKLLAASREYEQTKTSLGSFERIEELRKIAEKHTHLSITPGVLCYFFGALNQFCNTRDDIFPPSYQLAVERLWAATGELFDKWGGRADSFPKSAPLITGISADGWVGERIDIFYTQEEKIEIVLELPATAPVSAILITSEKNKYILLRGKTITISEILPQGRQHSSFSLSPVFPLAMIEADSNKRKISCFCHASYLIASGKKTNTLPN